MYQTGQSIGRLAHQFVIVPPQCRVDGDIAVEKIRLKEQGLHCEDACSRFANDATLVIASILLLDVRDQLAADELAEGSRSADHRCDVVVRWHLGRARQVAAALGILDPHHDHRGDGLFTNQLVDGVADVPKNLPSRHRQACTEPGRSSVLVRSLVGYTH